jgi:acylglycerol lipase
MKSGCFTTADGAKFSDVMWEPNGSPRARVVGLHGMGSAATEFAPLGEYLAELGMATHVPNLRGNGYDPNPARVGHSFSWAQFRSDFETYLEQLPGRSAEEPLFLIGESMGALLAITFLTEQALGRHFAGAVFFAPVFELRRATPWLVRQAVRMASWVAPRYSIPPALFIHGKDAPVPLTRDQAYQDYTLVAPHRVPSYSLQFTSGIGQLMDRANAAGPRLRTPFLLLNGGNDVFISPEQSARWFARAGSHDKTHLIFPECGHLLMHELNTREILENIGRWLEARLRSPTAPTAAPTDPSSSSTATRAL